jgi:hypothetical protein
MLSEINFTISVEQPIFVPLMSPCFARTSGKTPEVPFRAPNSFPET